MKEIPDFLKGIDPDMVRDLDQQLDIIIDEQQMTSIESYRQSFLEVLASKVEAIESFLDEPSHGNRYELSLVDEIAQSHFLYYLDQILAAPPMINKQIRLAEALSFADGTQTKLNQKLTGNPYVYNMDELYAHIARILYENDIEVAKQGLAEMYDKNIRKVVLQFVHDS